MRVEFYLILEPGADRPYICHQYPESYRAKEGSKVFNVMLDIPGFEKVSGVIQLAPTSIVDLTERLMAPEHIEDTEFTCPKCGCHFFGSSNIEGEGFRYQCHGQLEDGASCKFDFPLTDKNLYFKGTGHFSLATVVGTTGEP